MQLHRISLWASRHVWPARALLILCWLLLNTAGLFCGDLMALLHVHLSAVWLQAPALVAIIAAACYPVAGHKNATYRRRKMLDGVLIACTFLMVVFFGNSAGQAAALNPGSTLFTGSYAAHPDAPKATPTAVAAQAAQQAKRGINAGLQQFRHLYKDISVGGKIGLTALTVLVAVLLAYVLVALSCSIACSGAEALAVAVFVVGAAAIIFFGIRTIRYIFKGKRRKGRVF